MRLRTKKLHCMWPWVWDWKCGQVRPSMAISIWGQVIRKGFPEPSPLLHEAFEFFIIPRKSRCMDAARKFFQWHRLIWFYSLIYRWCTIHQWECWSGTVQGSRPVLWTQGKIHWIPQNISWRIYNIGRTRKWRQGLGFRLIPIRQLRCQERGGICLQAIRGSVEATQKSWDSPQK